MFLELIAAFAAGFLAAGVVLILNRLSGGRLPKWAMPAAAGTAMIVYAMYMEYTWFQRSAAEFPSGVHVVTTHTTSAPWRPWTYLWPIINRFTAIDTATIRSNGAVPGQHMAQIVFMGRWKAPRVLPMVFDCEGNRIAPLADSVVFDESGRVTEAEWTEVGVGDPALSLVCKED
ncbi:hypothetical protein [Tropicimonas sp.]|uniref:hypothetical protein n=1 Tax=Tropicimonas sp. TaxID=2067044 RepID=UPI003A878062